MHGQMLLETVLGEPVDGIHESGVVDQHVQPVVALEHVVCERSHLRKRGNVAVHELQLIVAGQLDDFIARLAPLFVLDVDQDQPRSQLRELARGDPSHAACGSRNQAGLIAQALLYHLRTL